MLPIARVQELAIYAPSKDWMISFVSSPRLIHAMARAVDISNAVEFGEEALSPVEGVVELVKELDVGPGPFSSTDYAIVIRCGKRFVKITHVAPSVLPGDRVRVGDPIGRYLRTNDVMWYSPPHMHVEVFSSIASWKMNLIKIVRPSIELVEFLRERKLQAFSLPKLRARVVHSSSSFTLLKPVDSVVCLSVIASRREAVLDGEVRPRTIYVGLLPLGRKLRPVGAVILLNAKIAQVKKLFGTLAIALNLFGPYRYTIYELSDGDPWRVLSEPIDAGSINVLDLRVNGKRVESIRVFLGTMACISVASRIEDSYAYITLKNVVI